MSWPYSARSALAHPSYCLSSLQNFCQRVDRADLADLVVDDIDVAENLVARVGDLERVGHGVTHVGDRRSGLLDEDLRMDDHQVVVVVVADLDGPRVDAARRDRVVHGRRVGHREVLGQGL